MNEIDGTMNVCVDILWRSINLSNTGKVTQLLVFIKVDCSENSTREERYFIHILDKVNIVRLVCYGLSILTMSLKCEHSL